MQLSELRSLDSRGRLSLREFFASCEAVPFQSRFKVHHYPRFCFWDWTGGQLL